jgi:Putative prokaryotic signal transducing protein
VHGFAVADVVATEQEAELLCGLLRSADIACISRQTNFGAGASDGMPTGGPYEVIVRAEDLDAAREVLGRDDDPQRVSGNG